ncbi:30S ribosomal protein S10 [Nanobdella aerobiophila]|uniref:Small ribosomal subunit protein uS10 n=1 Tax=Nanobdella aerobiophila TaxID=2586965 RepID=A0A915SES4_9ARCH|nr:uS10/mL48 family ribosomal protein [Nanobdella aerobiophila]BBL45210.1 30S ribosomal protein S10 [Nanobdella aerobiophila]
MSMIRIKMWGTDLDTLNHFTNSILKIIEQLGIEKRGPVTLPTKIIRIPSMRTLGKRGTKIYETYQMKIYRRFIDVANDERFFKSYFINMQIPSRGFRISLKILK